MCPVSVQYQVVKKLRNELVVLKGDMDTLQRLQQENHHPEKLVSQLSTDADSSALDQVCCQVKSQART